MASADSSTVPSKEGGGKFSPARYVRESIEELKKITPPTRAEAFQATVVTAVIVVFISVVVALMDLLFGRLMSAIL